MGQFHIFEPHKLPYYFSNNCSVLYSAKQA